MMVPERTNRLPDVKIFEKGEPLALGITQIFLGILTIVFGVVVTVGYFYSFLHRKFFFIYANIIVGTPFWTGVLYIISGSVTVRAAKNPKPSLVKGMLAMNVISACAAVFGIAYTALAPDYDRYDIYFNSTAKIPAGMIPVEVYEYEIIPYRTSQGIMLILLLFSILEFCITISNAWCKTICEETFTEKVVVVYQNAPPRNAFGSPEDGKIVLNP